MTLHEAIAALTGGVASLAAFLERAATNPELAAEAKEWEARLAAAVAASNLADLGSKIPGELLNIGTGKLEGAKHPADLA